MDSHSSNQSPLSPHFGQPPHVPSPPPANSGVRRHVSLTYGAATARKTQPLRRSGTLQAQVSHPNVSQSPSPPSGAEEEGYADDVDSYDDGYYTPSPTTQQSQGQYPTSPIGRQSPWNNSQAGEWRTPGSSFSPNSNNGSNLAIDDVSRALSALEVASNPNQSYQSGNTTYQSGQSVHPPRFNPSHPPPAQAPGGPRNANNNGNDNNGGGRKLQLVTDFDGRKTPSSQGHGPASASAYVPSVGGSYQQQQPQPRYGSGINDDRGQTGQSWDQKDRVLSGRASNPNLQYGYQQGQQGKNVPNVPPIPQQYLQQQGNVGSPRLGATSPYGQSQQGGPSQPPQGFINSPIDVPSLIAAKGYNPTNFDIRPQFVSIPFS